jgi:hypothetical protein
MCERKLNEEETGYLNAEFKLRCRACSHELGLVLSGATRMQILSIQKLSPADYRQATKPLSVSYAEELAQLTRKLISYVLERSPRVQATFG